MRKFIMKQLPDDLKTDIEMIVRLKTRVRPVVEKKAAIVRRLRDEFKLSYPMIGYLLHMDHSSIIHLYRMKQDTSPVPTGSEPVINSENEGKPSKSESLSQESG